MGSREDAMQVGGHIGTLRHKAQLLSGALLHLFETLAMGVDVDGLMIERMRLIHSLSSFHAR